MMAALSPEVDITAQRPNDGGPLADTLPPTEAAFVTGTYSDQAAAARASAQAAASATPFVLPGTTLGIFPVGLIITGAWTLLFVLTVGFGTISRIKFRNAFRRKIAAPAYRTRDPANWAGGPAAYDLR